MLTTDDKHMRLKTDRLTDNRTHLRASFKRNSELSSRLGSKDIVFVFVAFGSLVITSEHLNDSAT